MCRAIAASCECSIGDDDDHQIHVCDCGGSWEGDIDGEDFKVHSWPDVGIASLFQRMMGFSLDYGGFDGEL